MKQYKVQPTFKQLPQVNLVSFSLIPLNIKTCLCVCLVLHHDCCLQIPPPHPPPADSFFLEIVLDLLECLAFGFRNEEKGDEAAHEAQGTVYEKDCGSSCCLLEVREDLNEEGKSQKRFNI